MPKRVDLSDIDCSVARTLEVVGDKWSLLILRDAFYGVRRFGDFAEDLGVARNVLTDRLATLVESGVLDRREYQQSPVRHEYRLTKRGRDLLPVILAMMHWGDEHAPVEDEPPAQLVHVDCGNTTHGVMGCAHCGEELTPFNSRVEPLPEVAQRAIARRQELLSAG